MFSRILPIHSAGGMQDHVQTLSAGLVQRGHSVTVITTARADGAEFEIIDGVQVHFLRGAPIGRNTNAYWFGAAKKLDALHPVERFDILHSQSVGAYGVWRQGLPRRLGLPLITSFHGTHLDVLTTSWHTDFALTNPLGLARFCALAADLAFRYVYRDVWFARGSDILIATSDADVDKYMTLYRCPVERIRKVYNGIDTQLFSPSPVSNLQSLRAQLQIDPNDKIILALARLQKDKGVQNAIAALPRLLAQMRAVLIVVGDGDYRAALEKMARALGVAAHVRFVGAQSLAECARYFNLCDVFVDPTLRTDGYDLTIAEAMACAKPVIVSDVGANATLIDRATMCDGILIPRGDNAALVRETLRVLNAPALARSLGERGRAKIVARFSIAAMVQGMEQVYAEFV
jgi:glycosyltransferase involved in cell wall biosynthesis